MEGSIEVLESITEEWGSEPPDRRPHPGQKLPEMLHGTGLDVI